MAQRDELEQQPLGLGVEAVNTETSRGSQQKEAKDFVDSILYCLMAPLVLWPGYEDSFKDRWSDVLLHRLAPGANARNYEKGLCSEFEAMLYVSTATLNAPPSERWTRIYFWLFNKWNPQAAIDNDIPPQELGLNEKGDLDLLRRWIFKTQINRLKERRKTEPAAGPKPPKYEQPYLLTE